MLKSIRENKVLKFLGNLIYVILFIIVALILLVVACQRFSNNSIALGGFRIFNILTGSMRPVYEVGDVLLAKEVKPDEIKEGDDITYTGKEGDFNGKTITHRVISATKDENGKYTFITKGTANDIEDPQISEEQVQGKIIYRFVILSYISKMVNNLYSMYFIIFVPIAIIVFINVRRIYLNMVDPDDEEDDDDEIDEENDEEYEKLDKIEDYKERTSKESEKKTHSFEEEPRLGRRSVKRGKHGKH